MILSREFGAAMIISGTCIGAGMLAIPATVANCGFFIASLLIISIWILMTFTALVLAEVNLKMEEGSNFIEMTSQTIGHFGVVIIWICYILLLYSLVAAYTVGGGALLSKMLSDLGFNISEKVTSIIFILIFGIFIYINTQVVDHVNKLMLTGKLLAFFLLISILVPHVSNENLIYTIKNPNFIWAVFPILLTSFGFHHIIPTLRTYVRSNRSSLRKAIILGSSIPLIVYLIWIFVTLGSLPITTTKGILDKESGEITYIIINHFKETSTYILSISFSFGFFALATSFLGVSLGLFDFNRKTYKISKKLHKHKIIAFIVTFLPAYIYSIIYPNGFKLALGYASIFIAILQVALPVIMLWIINYRNKKNVISTSTITIIIIIIAIIIICLQIFNSIK